MRLVNLDLAIQQIMLGSQLNKVPQFIDKPKPRITKRTLTPMEKYNALKLVFEDAERGYNLYNPIKNTYVKNTNKNKLSIKKQIEE